MPPSTSTLPHALITGGSRGIGLAIARAFLPTHNLILVARDSHRLENARAALLNEGGGDCNSRVQTIAADLGSVAEIEAVGKHLSTATTNISVLVNAAGIATDALLATATAAHVESVLATNLTASILMARLVARGMIRRREGSIINIASVAGIKGNAGQSVYAASKAGLIGFTRALSRELGPRNIRVNAIAPGYIDTDMTQAIQGKKRDEYIAATALGRFGAPEDIADAALYLARARFVTGQCLVVDGGLSA
ncbi:uncharacterized protein EV422DRAFT_50688 [Fimicolochytrium jonesii]|uniref:uncharacterized protein n=1 Tax=Fimicolochytrium jonesii TaxID=1396493 RepID=UPI0022FE73E7|nr:uncharacterized protein EV422DRAFT_50688 [Fimicolochytrium jonesii]KAI8821047.1 hypothetical protein EV422DRAFT_50688 [Fimicolochytrium jonesii]